MELYHQYRWVNNNKHTVDYGLPQPWQNASLQKVDDIMDMSHQHQKRYGLPCYERRALIDVAELDKLADIMGGEFGDGVESFIKRYVEHHKQQNRNENTESVLI